MHHGESELVAPLNIFRCDVLLTLIRLVGVYDSSCNP